MEPHAASVLTKTTHTDTAFTVTLIPCHVILTHKQNQIQTQNKYTDKQKHMVMVGHTYSNMTFTLSFPKRYSGICSATQYSHMRTPRLTAIVYGGGRAEVVQVSI